MQPCGRNSDQIQGSPNVFCLQAESVFNILLKGHTLSPPTKSNYCQLTCFTKLCIDQAGYIIGFIWHVPAIDMTCYYLRNNH
jgi:hypothetical protein